jgi:hypothetical protein
MLVRLFLDRERRPRERSLPLREARRLSSLKLRKRIRLDVLRRLGIRADEKLCSL